MNANEKGLKELLRDGSISHPETAAVWYQSEDIARRLNKRINLMYQFELDMVQLRFRQGMSTACAIVMSTPRALKCIDILPSIRFRRLRGIRL